jgi:hypothetical protein
LGANVVTFPNESKPRSAHQSDAPTKADRIRNLHHVLPAAAGYHFLFPGMPAALMVFCRAVGSRQRAGLDLSAIGSDREIETELGADRRVALRQQFPESFKNVYNLPLRVHNVI